MSTFWVSELIHIPLHLTEHTLHPLHLDLSILKRNSENLENSPRIMPTGHILLQYALPHKMPNNKIITKVKIATKLNTNPLVVPTAVHLPKMLYGSINAASDAAPMAKNAKNAIKKA